MHRKWREGREGERKDERRRNRDRDGKKKYVIYDYDKLCIYGRKIERKKVS